jgi:hypothetical protein
VLLGLAARLRPACWVKKTQLVTDLHRIPERSLHIRLAGEDRPLPLCALRAFLGHGRVGVLAHRDGCGRADCRAS